MSGRVGASSSKFAVMSTSCWRRSAIAGATGIRAIWATAEQTRNCGVLRWLLWASARFLTSTHQDRSTLDPCPPESARSWPPERIERAQAQGNSTSQAARTAAVAADRVEPVKEGSGGLVDRSVEHRVD